jgi:uncharacterized protein (DUF4415 family)
MKQESNDIDPLAEERDLAGKKFIRGRDVGKLVSPEALDPRNIKVHVALVLDADILEYFEERASKPGALSYEAQINQALRDAMDREQGEASGESLAGDDSESPEMLLSEIRRLLPKADEATISTLIRIVRDFRVVMEPRTKQDSRKLAEDIA